MNIIANIPLAVFAPPHELPLPLSVLHVNIRGRILNPFTNNSFGPKVSRLDSALFLLN